jgi:hypothetical protein
MRLGDGFHADYPPFRFIIEVGANGWLLRIWTLSEEEPVLRQRVASAEEGKAEALGWLQSQPGYKRASLIWWTHP